MTHVSMKSLAVLACAALLGACSSGTPASGDGTSAKPDTSSVKSALSPEAVQAAAKKAKAASLPQPDPSTPDSDYVEIKSGNQLMYLYAANSGLPPDYKSMASDISSQYRRTSDQFRKHDLMKALKPKIDAGIANAKAHPYLMWSIRPELGHYDFKRKGFVVGAAIMNDGYGY